LFVSVEVRQERQIDRVLGARQPVESNIVESLVVENQQARVMEILEPGEGQQRIGGIGLTGRGVHAGEQEFERIHGFAANGSGHHQAGLSCHGEKPL